MGRFFGWKLRKHICIPNFYSGQYHQTIFHDTYFSNCIFSFICWQKSSILRISLKKFLSLKVFEDFSKFQRIFVFVFSLFSTWLSSNILPRSSFYIMSLISYTTIVSFKKPKFNLIYHYVVILHWMSIFKIMDDLFKIDYCWVNHKKLINFKP